MIVFALLMVAIVWLGTASPVMIAGASGTGYCHAFGVSFGGNCFNWPVLFHDLNVFRQRTGICVESAFHCKISASDTG